MKAMSIYGVMSGNHAQQYLAGAVCRRYMSVFISFQTFYM